MIGARLRPAILRAAVCCLRRIPRLFLKPRNTARMASGDGAPPRPSAWACTRLPPTEAGIAAAGACLRAGGCVAFPTETVYGLGAHAMDEAAVAAVFKFKGRPLTDPLIVHVPDAPAALRLLVLPPPAHALASALADAFWPGPLTLVGKASPGIPLSVTAGTGFVGVRVPAHPLARRLLLSAGVPVAAPSANRFGHVSPTSAEHVIADLGHCPIAVLEGEAESQGPCAASLEGGAASTCAVGIESTVVKVELLPDAPDTWTDEASGPVGHGGSTGTRCGGISSVPQPEDGSPIADGAAATSAADTAPAEAALTARDVARLRLVVFRRGGVSVPELERSCVAALGRLGHPGCTVPVVFHTLHSTAPATPGPAGSSAAGAAPSAAGSQSLPAQHLPHTEPALNEQAGGEESHAAASSNVAGPGGHGRDAADNGDDAAESSPSVGSEAPGMLLTHYAPDVPAFLVTAFATEGHAACVFSAPSASPATPRESAPLPFDHALLPSTVILDIGGVIARGASAHPGTGSSSQPGASAPRAIDSEGHPSVAHSSGIAAACLSYADLAPGGSVLQARAALFSGLRWCENVPSARAVLLADPLLLLRRPPSPSLHRIADGAPEPLGWAMHVVAPASGAGGEVEGAEHVDALRDRMFRAASGRTVAL